VAQLVVPKPSVCISGGGPGEVLPIRISLIGIHNSTGVLNIEYSMSNIEVKSGFAFGLGVLTGADTVAYNVRKENISS